MNTSNSYQYNATRTLYNDDSVAASWRPELTVSNMTVEAFQNTTQAVFSNPGL